MTNISPPPGAITRLVEEQFKQWKTAQDLRKKGGPTRPVITISRQPGSRSHILTKRIAEVLKLDIMGSKIVHEVAKSVNMSDEVVASLDEKEKSILDHWIQLLKSAHYLWPDQYLVHLTNVIVTIGEHGGALILGRGANRILPAQETLRIRFVAPMEVKIKNLTKDRNISEDEAKKFITKTEADRKAFVKKYFASDIDDPMNYDFVINTQFINDDAIIDLVKASVKTKAHPMRRRFD